MSLRCSLGGGGVFLILKGIKYFENTAKEMEKVFWEGCFYLQKRRKMVPSSLFRLSC